MKHRNIVAWVLVFAAATLLVHCLSAPRVILPIASGPGAQVQTPLGSAASSAPVVIPGLPLGDGEHAIGPPKVMGNLAVFPVYASVQESLGEFTTLEAAIESGAATVRERGSDSAIAEQAASNRNTMNARQLAMGNGATVNQLEIDNKGNLPILVLAGSVVKGGKQDRQISQDFVVGPKETVSVDAFCVEHGRWNANREGVETNGKFKAVRTLAQGGIRAAGQYQRDQGRVWAKVGEVNRAHKKAAATDTLMATLDDETMATKRATMGRDLLGFLAAVPASSSVVGIAYAVDGKVRGVRWFFHHDIFAKYGETLVNTAVFDALTAEASRPPAQPPANGACEPAAVAEFIAKIETAQVEQRDTNAQNVNEVREADVGYSSSASLKAPSKGGGKKKAVTKDYLSK